MEKTLWIVTHGDRPSNIPDPPLSEEGRTEVKNLLVNMPHRISDIVSGTGRRHLETAEILGIRPDKYSPTVGVADCSDILNGEKVALLPSGETVKLGDYIISDGRSLFPQLQDNTLLIAGRPLLISLGYPQAVSGGLYRIILSGQTVKIDIVAEPETGKIDIH